MGTMMLNTDDDDSNAEEELEGNDDTRSGNGAKQQQQTRAVTVLTRGGDSALPETATVYSRCTTGRHHSDCPGQPLKHSLGALPH